VPNGTDPERFRPLDASSLRNALALTDTSVVLTVSRLVPRKGIDTVLRALPEVLDAVPSLTYLVVGTGPDRERLERLATNLGIRPHVHFTGHVPFDDLPRYYNAADVFAMPSREASPDVEGFGLVFLEAGACGIPVIGARTGGIPDAIQDGETGLLVPPSSPEALANALTRLLSSPDLAHRLGEQGRRHVVQEANWDHVADQLWNVLVSA
jgi:phosphatidylinositol alpha-1,6-mannosyltransferase